MRLLMGHAVLTQNTLQKDYDMLKTTHFYLKNMLGSLKNRRKMKKNC